MQWLRYFEIVIKYCIKSFKNVIERGRVFPNMRPFPTTFLNPSHLFKIQSIIMYDTITIIRTLYIFDAHVLKS